MIVLNRKSGKTSRFYVNGANFTAASKVWLNTKECDETTYIDPTLLHVKLKWKNWPMMAAAPSGMVATAGTATGEVDVTITVKEGLATSTPTLVKALDVDDHDLPP